MAAVASVEVKKSTGALGSLTTKKKRKKSDVINQNKLYVISRVIENLPGAGINN